MPDLNIPFDRSLMAESLPVMDTAKSLRLLRILGYDASGPETAKQARRV
jgi:hypothetical protein